MTDEKFKRNLTKLAELYPNLEFNVSLPQGVHLDSGEVVFGIRHRETDKVVTVIAPKTMGNEWFMKGRLGHFNEHGTMEGYR